MAFKLEPIVNIKQTIVPKEDETQKPSQTYSPQWENTPIQSTNINNQQSQLPLKQPVFTPAKTDQTQDINKDYMLSPNELWWAEKNIYWKLNPIEQKQFEYVWQQWVKEWQQTVQKQIWELQQSKANQEYLNEQQNLWLQGRNIKQNVEQINHSQDIADAQNQLHNLKVNMWFFWWNDQSTMRLHENDRQLNEAQLKFQQLQQHYNSTNQLQKIQWKQEDNERAKKIKDLQNDLNWKVSQVVQNAFNTFTSLDMQWKLNDIDEIEKIRKELLMNADQQISWLTDASMKQRQFLIEQSDKMQKDRLDAIKYEQDYLKQQQELQKSQQEQEAKNNRVDVKQSSAKWYYTNENWQPLTDANWNYIAYKKDLPTWFEPKIIEWTLYNPKTDNQWNILYDNEWNPVYSVIKLDKWKDFTNAQIDAYAKLINNKVLDLSKLKDIDKNLATNPELLAKIDIKPQIKTHYDLWDNIYLEYDNWTTKMIPKWISPEKQADLTLNEKKYLNDIENKQKQYDIDKQKLEIERKKLELDRLKTSKDIIKSNTEVVKEDQYDEYWEKTWQKTYLIDKTTWNIITPNFDNKVINSLMTWVNEDWNKFYWVYMSDKNWPKNVNSLYNQSQKEWLDNFIDKYKWNITADQVKQVANDISNKYWLDPTQTAHLMSAVMANDSAMWTKGKWANTNNPWNVWTYWEKITSFPTIIDWIKAVWEQIWKRFNAYMKSVWQGQKTSQLSDNEIIALQNLRNQPWNKDAIHWIKVLWIKMDDAKNIIKSSQSLLTNDQKDIAKKISEWDYSFKDITSLFSNFRWWDKTKQELLWYVDKLNPTFNSFFGKNKADIINKWNDPNSVVWRNNVKLGTALWHMQLFENYVNSISQGDMQSANKFLNSIWKEFGYTTKTTLDTYINAVASEMASAYKWNAAPSSEEINSWKSTISDKSTPEQLKQWINQSTNLLTSRIETQSKLYQNATDEKPKSYLQPEVENFIKNKWLDLDKYFDTGKTNIKWNMNTTNIDQEIIDSF